MTELEAYLNESRYRKHDLELIRQLMGPWLSDYPALKYNRVLYDLWSRYSGTQTPGWLAIDTEAIMGFIGWMGSEANKENVYAVAAVTDR